jgi:predicted nucleotide-binding protein
MYQVVLTSQRGVWTDRDLSEEVVRDQIAVPYLQGEHVFVDQALFHPSAIESLAIYFSEKPLTAVLHELQNLRALSFRGGAFSRSEVLARMGVDVTDRLLQEAREFIVANPSEQQAALETRDKIFLVHGRNLRIRNSLLALLQAMRLRPLQWEGAVNEAKSPSPYIGDVLDAVFDAARAVVVLITGDDEARLRRRLWGPSEPSHERRYNPQARPNVLFEAGMAFAKCSNRTVIASVGYTRPFSDIAGRYHVYLDGDDGRLVLADRLRMCGCRVEPRPSWTRIGRFSEVE